jgi:hypothetical protein
MFALVVDVAPARIAGVQKPGMARAFHILVSWIPAIPAGMTASIFSTTNAYIAFSLIGIGFLNRLILNL